MRIKQKSIRPNAYPSMFRCALCDREIKKKELWATKAEELDETTCVCENCVSVWHERQNKPLRELIGTVKIHKSMIALLKEEHHERSKPMFEFIEKKQRERKLKQDRESLTDDPLENLTNLMRAALIYPDIRSQLLTIVNLNSFHRSSIVNTIIYNIELTGGPKQMIHLLTALKDDRVAEKAKELLEKK
jgi:hypothetical protein